MGYIQEVRAVFGNRPLILTAAGVFILNEAGEILLQHRADTHDWGIPGGYMEPGESSEETARREVFEETGLTVGELTFFEVFSGSGFFFKYPNGDQVHLVNITYITRDVRGELRTDSEGLELRYFPLDNLPDKLIPSGRYMMERLKNKLKG